MLVNVQVSVDGRVETTSVDLGSLTLAESVRLQDQVGDQKWDDFVAGKIRPDVLRALIWVKLSSRFPKIAMSDIDGSWGDIEAGNPTERD